MGGNNWNFEKEASKFRNQSNEMFINFLQSDLALELMRKNKIKIHISSGDIYINNNHTNESFYDFLAVQDNENYILIDKEFIFDGTLTEYYNTYLTDNSLSIEDDFTTNRNSKFLYLHFNNVLQMTGVPTYKLRHTVIIKNEKSIELMQKSNWQYFITTLMNHAEDKLLHSTSEYTEEEQETIRPYIDKLISHGEMYKDIYSSIALSFHNVFENLPNEQFEQIFKDLKDNNVYLGDLFNKISPEQLLNIFLDFYYLHGRFPGDSNLILLPSFDIPKKINNSIIDFQELFFKFKNTYFQSLTSIQAICALCKYISSQKNIDILIKDTIEELLNNLLEENLHYFEGKISYNKIISLMKITIDNLNNINKDINKQREVVTEHVNQELNKYKNEQNIEEIIDPEIALLPLNTEEKLTKNEDYINELEKFLVQIEPTVDGIRQIKSENKEKLNLDIDNIHVKIDDNEEVERTNENEKKINDDNDLPKLEPFKIEPINLPNINENIDGINSNDNILKVNEDKFITNIEQDDDDFISATEKIPESIEFDLTEPIEIHDKFSLDLDQDEKNIKLEFDNDLDIDLKYEETEPGFLTDFPSKDNLGEQIIEIDTDDNKIVKQEEMDTNYERPIVVLPTSNLANLKKRKLKREEPIKSKILRDSIYQRPVLKNDIEFVTQRPVHPRNRKNRKIFSKPITKKIKQEMLDRYYADQNEVLFEKNKKQPDFKYQVDDVQFMKQLPIHPKNRKNRIIKKEEIDTNYDKSTVVYLQIIQ